MINPGLAKSVKKRKVLCGTKLCYAIYSMTWFTQKIANKRIVLDLRPSRHFIQFRELKSF
jgi:hypothetical protein